MVIAPSPTPTQEKNLDERLRLLDIRSPVDPEASNRWTPAPRLNGIRGKTGGFLGNKKANSGQLLEAVKDLMQQRYELGEGVVLDKYIYSRPAAADIIDSLADRCDFVVTAIAD